MPKGWPFVTETGQLLQHAGNGNNLLMDLGGTQLKAGDEVVTPYVLVLIQVKVASVIIGVLIRMLVFMVVTRPIVVMNCLGLILFFVDMRNGTVGKDHRISCKKPE